MTQQSGGVVGHLLVAERSLDVGGVPMRLLLNADDLPRPGKGRQHLAERGADSRQSSVKQDQRWLAASVNLVVHLETVYRSVAALDVHVSFLFCHLLLISLRYYFITRNRR